MATFDPTEREESSDMGGVPPGEYLIALTYFDYKTSERSGAKYLRCGYRVIAGPHKGEDFYSNIGVDLGKKGTRTRWSLWCDCVGVGQKFDNEDQEAIEVLFKNQPFKARINRQQNGKWINNDIERYVLPKDLTIQEQETMKQWKLSRKAAEQAKEAMNGRAYEDSPHPADGWDDGDDIPF